MLSPVLRLACSSMRPLGSPLLAALWLCIGCAQVAGFDDFKGPETGGKRNAGTDTSTGGPGFVPNSSATEELGGTSPVYVTLGGTSATGGTSSTGAGGSRAG